MTLNVYNTLTRRLEEFRTIDEGYVRMYVCGPTVYDHPHIGHGKSYVSFDVIVRYLRYLGYKVKYVQNITDVGHLTDNADQGEDKILARAARDRVDPMELVETYTRSYFQDMDALNILRPDISPRASAHIPEQIELTKTLLDKGFAYEANGSVYFDVSRFPSYGSLSGKRVDELEAGARVDVNPDKRHPSDFALWKKAERGHILRWNSPWGWGYPGWHLECSVMSMRYLGDTIDIHGGGLENAFPHHESEIAQSESATGKPFVRYWLHNNMVTVNGTKMGKSLGNFTTLKDAFRKHHPLAIRYFVLTSHYRSPLDFSDAAIEAAQKGLERIHETVARIRAALASPAGGAAPADTSKALSQVDEFRKRFEDAMNDDFNTPSAIAVLSDMVRHANSCLSAGADRAVLEHLNDAFKRLGGDVLGVVTDRLLGEQTGAAGLDSKLIALLIGLRGDMRKAGNFAGADEVRKGLSALGIQLKDGPEGTTWKRS